MGVKTIAGLEAKARQGDPVAFGELVTRWDSDLRGIVWSVVRSALETDDIMQTAYEKAFRSLASFENESSMKTWLHSICYRAAIDHVRSEKRRQHESTDQLARRPDDRSTSDDAIARVDLAAALERLDPEVRALLMMTAGLGFTFDEAAKIAGLERGTVASKVGRAKKALRSLNRSPKSSIPTKEAT